MPSCVCIIISFAFSFDVWFVFRTHGRVVVFVSPTLKGNNCFFFLICKPPFISFFRKLFIDITEDEYSRFLSTRGPFLRRPVTAGDEFHRWNSSGCIPRTALKKVNPTRLMITMSRTICRLRYFRRQSITCFRLGRLSCGRNAK